MNNVTVTVSQSWGVCLGDEVKLVVNAHPGVYQVIRVEQKYAAPENLVWQAQPMVLHTYEMALLRRDT